jgi:NitT/TauT family transport system substrate-binding protein
MRPVSMKSTSILIAVCASLLAGPAFADGEKEKVTNVMAGDGFQYAIQHIAERGGFFAEEGLDVQSVDAGSGARQAAALMGGSADFGGFGMVQAIKADAMGGSLVAVSSMLDSYDQQIVLSNAAVEKSGITDGMSIEEKVKRLHGLRIAITSPGSTTDIIVRSMLKQRGLDADQELQILPMGGGTNMLAAMQKGSTDAFIWAAPQAQMAVGQNVGKIIVNPLNGDVPEMVGVHYLVLVTSRDTLEKKPKVILAAVRALTRAMKFVHEQPEKAHDLLRQQFPDVDQKVFDAAWSGYLKAIPTTPVIDQDQYEKTVEWLNITSEPPANAPYETVVADGPARQAAQELLAN